MSLRRVHRAVLSLCVLTTAALGQKLFMLPAAGTSQNTTVCNAATFACGSSIAGPAGSTPNSRGLPVAFSNNSGTRYFLVAPIAAKGLTVLDSSGTLVKAFDLAAGPSGAALSPDGRKLLIAASNLYIFDVSGADIPDPSVIAPGTGSIGTNPVDVAVSLDASRAYVLSGAGSLSAINLADLSVTTKDVGAGTVATGVTAGPDGRLYVTATGKIIRVDGATLDVIDTKTAEGVPGKVTFSPDGSFAVSLRQGTMAQNAPADWIITTAPYDVVPSLLGVLPPQRVLFGPERRLFMFTSVGRSLYEVSATGNVVFPAIDPIANVPAGKVVAAVASPEWPHARYIFVLEQIDSSNYRVRRIDTSGSADDQTIASTTRMGALAFAAPPSDGPATELLAFNQNQTVAPSATTSPLIVRALDAAGMPVHGASISFSSAGLAVQNATVATNAAGFSQRTVVAPLAEGSYIIEAAAASTGAAETFTINVSSTAGNPGNGGGDTDPGTGPSGVSVYSGNGQVLVDGGSTLDAIGTEHYKPLVAVVRDAGGNPLPGAEVTWTIPSEFGTLIHNIGTHVGGSGTATLVSKADVNGVAGIDFISTLLPMQTPYRTVPITATSAGSTATFYITVVPGRTLGILALPGVAFVKPEAGESIIGNVGTTLNGAVQILVYTSGQVPQYLPKVGLEILSENQDPTAGPVASCAGGTALTNNDGIATCNVVITGKPGTTTFTIRTGGYGVSRPLPFTATPGSPTNVVKVAGEQSGDPGQTIQLRARITDGANNGLSGVSAEWQVVSGGVTLGNKTTTTNSAGEVTATVTLGSTPGAAQVRVTAGSAAATFNLTVNVAAATLTRVSGFDQATAIDTAFSAPLLVEVRDAQNQPVANAPVTFVVQSGSATLGSPTTTTNAQGQASTTVQALSTPGSIVVNASAGSLQAVTFNLTARLPGPVFTANSVVNGASFLPGVVAGGIVTITGTGIAPNVQGCVSGGSVIGPLPTELAGVQVLLDYNPAPIYAVCNVNGKEQINVQAPFELGAGNITVTVIVDGVLTSVSPVQVVAAQPGIFEFEASDGIRAIVLRPDGSLATAENPARRGEVVTMYATGLGPVLPLASTNVPGRAGQSVYFPVSVGINNVPVQASGAQYAANQIGLYVVTFAIPSDAATGTVPLAMSATPPGQEAAVSNTSRITIQP